MRDQEAGQAAAAAQRDVQRILEAGARYWLGQCAGIFVCEPARLAERVVLPAGLGERAVLASRPHVRPLLAALQHRPGYQVAVVNGQHAWPLKIAGEHVGIPVPQPSAGSLTRTPAGWDWLGTRRADKPIGRFLRYEFPEAAAILADAPNTGDDEQALVIAGFPDAVAEFLAALPGAARDRFAGSLTVNPVMMTPARAGELADPVVRYRADRSEQELLARIRHEPPGGRAAVGLTNCLAAADRHAVETLAVPRRGTVPGYECRRCGALGTTGPGCACGPAAAYPIPDLIEELVAAAIRAGGRVQTSDDPPGGIAACLRFPAADRTRSAA